MKYFVLGAGALGFAVVAIAGFTAERLPDLVVRDASLACLATALLGRWFWRVLDRAFADTVAVRRAAVEAAEEAEAAEAAKKKETVAAASNHNQPALGQRNPTPAAQTSR
jgi:hypothetical protein